MTEPHRDDELLLGQVDTPEGPVDVVAWILPGSLFLFTVYVAYPPDDPHRHVAVLLASRRGRLEAHQRGEVYLADVLRLVTPDVWVWAWSRARAHAKERVAELRLELRDAEIDLLRARAHTDELPALTRQALLALIDGWRGTASELLDAANLIDQPSSQVPCGPERASGGAQAGAQGAGEQLTAEHDEEHDDG